MRTLEQIIHSVVYALCSGKHTVVEGNPYVSEYMSTLSALRNNEVPVQEGVKPLSITLRNLCLFSYRLETQYSFIEIFDRFPKHPVIKHLYFASLEVFTELMFKVQGMFCAHEKYPEIRDLYVPFVEALFTDVLISDIARNPEPVTGYRLIEAASSRSDQIQIFLTVSTLMLTYSGKNNAYYLAIMNNLSDFLKHNGTGSRQNFSVFAFVFETLLIMLHPEYINQKNHNLCGIATFLYILIKNSPHVYAHIAMELFEQGRTRTHVDICFPENLKSRDLGKAERINFYEYLMIGLKQTQNYFGYQPDNAGLEAFGGVTRPVFLVNLLEKVGYHDISENMSILTQDKSEVGIFFRFIYGGLYSKYHQELIRNVDLLNNLQISIAQGKAVVLLVGSSTWTFEESGSSSAPILKTTQISVDHYITLVNIKVNATDDAVEIHFMDSAWGGIRQSTLKCAEALRTIHGAIICTPPSRDNLAKPKPATSLMFK